MNFRIAGVAIAAAAVLAAAGCGGGDSGPAARAGSAAGTTAGTTAAKTTGIAPADQASHAPCMPNQHPSEVGPLTVRTTGLCSTVAVSSAGTVVEFTATWTNTTGLAYSQITPALAWGWFGTGAPIADRVLVDRLDAGGTWVPVPFAQPKSQTPLGAPFDLPDATASHTEHLRLRLGRDAGTGTLVVTADSLQGPVTIGLIEQQIEVSTG